MEFLFDRQRQLSRLDNVTEGGAIRVLRHPRRRPVSRASSRLRRGTYRRNTGSSGRAMTQTLRPRSSPGAHRCSVLVPRLVMHVSHTLLGRTHRRGGESAYQYQRTLGFHGDFRVGVSIGISARITIPRVRRPSLGLKRVSATTSSLRHASILATSIRPQEAIANLERLAAEGALGPMGLRGHRLPRNLRACRPETRRGEDLWPITTR